MAFQTYYRKYRPSVLSEVVGQTMPVRTLKNALAKGEIAHAWLFHGPRGTGKTSVARILARSLNCDTGVNTEPCGVCPNCQDILKGIHPEIVEMDAASNSKVEEIRRLLDTLWVPRTRARYKVYILDEVHMLSTSAFNALLKNVEEPPPGLVFILATTEPHKVPATIRSRCQEFAFGRVAPKDMGPALEHIMAKEHLQADEGVLGELCRASEGCMRDALSLLQQLASTSDGPLNLELLRLLTGQVGEEACAALLTLLNEGNYQDVFTQFEHWHTRGQSLQEVIQEFRHHLSERIMKGEDGRALLGMMRWADKLDHRLTYERDPLLAVEAALARLAADKNLPAETAPVAERPLPVASPAKTPAPTAPASSPRPTAAVKEPPAQFGGAPKPAATAPAAKASAEWEGFVKFLMRKDVPLMAMLSQTTAVVEADAATVHFPAKWRLDALRKQGKEESLSTYLAEYLGRNVQVHLTVAGEGAASEAPAVAPAARTPRKEVSTPVPSRPVESAKKNTAPFDAFFERVNKVIPGSTIEPIPGGDS